MVKDKTEVGSPMNFRGMMYKPINEQGVVYLFGLVAEDLNIRVESIQQGYPDCTAIRYLGKGRWERVRVEFEFNANNFFIHKHEPKEINIIVCWEDDLNDEQRKILTEQNIEIIALKDRIKTDEIPDKELSDPELSSKEEADIEHHLREISEKTKKLYFELDKSIKEINSEIWDKYSKTMITYYSPEKVFSSIHFRKNNIAVDVYTNKEKLNSFENVQNHENWGRTTIHNEEELQKVIPSIKKSFEIMKKAENEGINTGWYALTPKDKMSWINKDSACNLTEED